MGDETTSAAPSMSISGPLRVLAGCASITLALVCAPRPATAQNVILVIADDVGPEWFTSYGEQQGDPPTPTICHWRKRPRSIGVSWSREETSSG